MVSLLGFALATGLLFARVSRPNAHIIFSRSAIVAPYRGITALEFRIANERRNELIEVEVTVILSRVERVERKGNPENSMKLKLERNGVIFLPRSAGRSSTPSQDSPLHGLYARRNSLLGPRES